MSPRLKRLLRRPTMVFGVLVLTMFLAVALFAPLLPLANPIDLNMAARLKPPSNTNLLGTDTFGRDLLSRIVWGARVSLRVGLASVLVGCIAGATVGLLAGYAGGKWDAFLMRTMDIILAFPSLVLAMAIAAALGPNLNNAILAVAIVSIPRYARLVRSSVITIRELEFVEAARALGASRLRTAVRHLLANSLGPIIVQATLGFGQAIISVAGLSFIGLGAQPPTPEWGAIITEGRYYVLSGRWWLTVFPGLSIALTVLGFNLVGDTLRDYLDPRLR